MTEKPQFVYVTYIAAPPEKVWEALTKPDISEKYWFGYRVAADGKPGDRMTATSPAGKLAHDVRSWKAIRRAVSSMRGSRSTRTCPKKEPRA
jgi:uncharacterized protein YndB with AHSA1/START domain